jgi:GT2 family glycosyltransferase
MAMTEKLGAVAIGRNEGPRLTSCLKSLAAVQGHLVYVDSGSTDGSVEEARRLGAEVVILDPDVAFTAARARNAGWRRLLEQFPSLEYVQFVDADCEIVSGWLKTGVQALEHSPTLGIVCGRNRERYPGVSVYNRLVDMEWNTPIGDAKSCGGTAMIRALVLRETGGFDDRLIAGEEPEMCVRIRAGGWRIQRIAAEMSFHDIEMTRFKQWFRRAERAGHAFAEGFSIHGGPPEHHYRRETRSIVFWAGILPVVLLLATVGLSPWFLLAFSIFPMQMLRTAIHRRRSFGDPWSHCLAFGTACVLAKWPQLCGMLVYWKNRIQGRRARIIEYKPVASVPGVKTTAGSGTSL